MDMVGNGYKDSVMVYFSLKCGGVIKKWIDLKDIKG